MTKSDISAIAPFFIVRNVPAALSFYHDRLGFDVTFEGPEPDDIRGFEAKDVDGYVLFFGRPRS